MKVVCTGCSLADFLYAHVNFAGHAFRRYLSQTDGDGGLAPGRLVFTEDLERFAGKPFAQIRRELTGGAGPDAFNLGGPAIVALVNAAQLSHARNIQFSFHGAVGRDDAAQKILNILRQTPVNIEHYLQLDGVSPFTDVFSDPEHNHGKGERTFVNNIGVAWQYTMESLAPGFFDADIAFFGGTALLPNLHRQLTSLLKKSKTSGCANIVATVFDFHNEKLYAGNRWPLGESDESYRLIDLLIVDMVEALRLSGSTTIDAAIKFFINSGVHSFIITHGAENFHAWSDGQFFAPHELVAWPVCALVGERLARHPELKGDTTGCGDNFAGGVLASTAQQLLSSKIGKLDLRDACAWGCASGGFACFHIGGTYLEQVPGEKKTKVAEFQQAFMRQLK